MACISGFVPHVNATVYHCSEHPGTPTVVSPKDFCSTHWVYKRGCNECTTSDPFTPVERAWPKPQFELTNRKNGSPERGQAGEETRPPLRRGPGATFLARALPTPHLPPHSFVFPVLVRRGVSLFAVSLFCSPSCAQELSIVLVRRFVSGNGEKRYVSRRH